MNASWQIMNTATDTYNHSSSQNVSASVIYQTIPNEMSEKFNMRGTNKCAKCGKSKGHYNTMVCSACSKLCCNDCWIILNPDPNAVKLFEQGFIDADALGKIFDPKAREIQWGCPLCRYLYFSESIDEEPITLEDMRKAEKHQSKQKQTN